MSTKAVVPAVSGSVYTFTFGDTVFAVDAAKAGRIVKFSLAGKNILTTARNAEDNNWGSTFWTSPQSDWNWPPPKEMDPGGYSARLDGAAVVCESATLPALGLAVTKRFSVDAGGNTSVRGAEGPELLKPAAEQAVATWVFRRQRAERLPLRAVFTFSGNSASAAVGPIAEEVPEK